MAFQRASWDVGATSKRGTQQFDDMWRKRSTEKARLSRRAANAARVEKAYKGVWSVEWSVCTSVWQMVCSFGGLGRCLSHTTCATAAEQRKHASADARVASLLSQRMRYFEKIQGRSEMEEKRLRIVV